MNSLWCLTNLSPEGTPGEEGGQILPGANLCAGQTLLMPPPALMFSSSVQRNSTLHGWLPQMEPTPPLSLHLSPSPTLPITFTQGEAAEGPDGDPKAKSTALEIVPHDGGNTGWQALNAELSWLWAGISWGNRDSWSPEELGC